MRLVVVLFFCFLVSTRMAAAQGAEPLAFSAFLDTYYAYDHDFDGRKRPYVTQPSYNEETAVNLTFADIVLAYEKWRGRAAVQYGTSADINYSAEEHEGWKYVQEAFIGHQLVPSLWIDAGIFFSHIGMESWISRDNPTYTRSLVAEYSPYYQTGIRVTYEVSPTLSLQVLGLRGWQNISDERDPALGTQLQWKASESVTLLHNTFIGNEDGKRIFNDFILRWNPSESWQLAGQFDLGYQRQPAADNDAWWHGWALVARYAISKKSAVALRLERFYDPDSAVLVSASDDRFGAYGASVNFDYEALPQLLWRTELRRLQDSRNVFPDSKGGFDRSDAVVVTSLAYTFR